MRRLCDGLVVAVFVGLAAKLAGPLAGREVREGYTSVCSWTNRRSPGLLPTKFRTSTAPNRPSPHCVSRENQKFLIFSTHTMRRVSNHM